VRQPQGAAIKTAAPTNTYPCADGKWLCIAGNSDLIFKRLMGAIGQPAMAADPRFATNGGRCDNVAELDAAIADWTRTKTGAEAEAILEAAEVPCSRLFDIADCATDPHFRDRGWVMEVTDPLLGPVLHPAAPFRFDGVHPREMVRWPGVAAGAHNDKVFGALERGETAPLSA
jgi:formyl-CoA transferase